MKSTHLSLVLVGLHDFQIFPDSMVHAWSMETGKHMFHLSLFCLSRQSKLVSPQWAKKDSNNPSPGRTSLPANILWGSFLMHSFLPGGREGEMNAWRTNPKGRLWGGYGRIRSVKCPTPGPKKTIKSPPHALPSPQTPTGFTLIGA